MNTKLKKYVVYTKSVPVFVSVNLFFSVCKHHGYSRNAFCDKIFTYEEYTERISTLSPMLEYREEQINRSRDRNCLFVKNVLFESVYLHYVHFSALRFRNDVPDVHQILHAMSILIPGDVPRVSRS